MEENSRPETPMRSTESLQLLSETAGKLLATRMPQTILPSLCRKVMTHLGCQVFLCHLVDDTLGRLQLNASSGVPEDAARELQWLDYGVGVCGSVAREGRRVVLEDIPEAGHDQPDRLRALRLECYVCIPLSSDGRLVGTLAFGSRSKSRISEDDLSLLTRFADQVAIAIDRAKLIEALEKRKKDDESRLAADADASSRRLREEIERRRGAEKDLRKLSCHLEQRVKQRDCLSTILYVIGRRGLPMEEKLREIVNSLPSGLRYPERVCARIVLEGVECATGSFRVTPWNLRCTISADGEPVGSLEVYDLQQKHAGDEGRFLIEEKMLIDSVAASLGEMVEHARSDRAIQRSNALLHLFSEKTTCNEYLDKALELIASWCSCRGAGIRVLDPSSGQIAYESTLGFTPEFLESEGRLSVEREEERCVCARVIVGRPDPLELPMITPAGSFRCDDLARFIEELQDEQKLKYRGGCVRSGFKSIAVIPIPYQGQILGAIQLADQREGALAPAVIRFVESVAPLIGEALHRFGLEEDLRESERNLQLLSAELMTAQEMERKRIAREMHDSIGQSLSAIKYRVEAAQQLRRKARVKEQLKELVPILQQTVEELRRIQMDLRPPALDDLGLLPALEVFFRRFGTTYQGIRIERKLDAEAESVPDSLKSVLYRITQEAFNNAAKHSGADHVSFSLTRNENGIELCIGDNGRGFDPARETEDVRLGMGLKSMRERAEISGGVFELRAAPGSGTRIRSSWKLPRG